MAQGRLQDRPCAFEAPRPYNRVMQDVNLAADFLHSVPPFNSLEREALLSVARKLEADGWIRIQTKPWTGRGMSATWAYNATAKWKELGL